MSLLSSQLKLESNRDLPKFPNGARSSKLTVFLELRSQKLFASCSRWCLMTIFAQIEVINKEEENGRLPFRIMFALLDKYIDSE